MSLNLHSIVRGAIQAINADQWVNYLKSTGYGLSGDGTGQQVPIYAPVVMVKAQIQPPTGRDLRHAEFLNIQGTMRVAYLYSNPQAVVRIASRGGDLLQFPHFNAGKNYLRDSSGDLVTDSNGNFVWSVPPAETWLVTYVDETWDVVGTGWSKVYVTLQTDPTVQMNLS